MQKKRGLDRMLSYKNPFSLCYKENSFYTECSKCRVADNPNPSRHLVARILGTATRKPPVAPPSTLVRTNARGK